MRPIINKKAKYEVIPVGNESTGIIYLEKRGSLSVGEARDIDSIDAKRQKAAIIASKLVKKISVDRGVTIAEAQELLSPTRSADGATEVDNSDVIYDYIEDFTELNALSSIDSASVSISVATLFIKKRVAFPVELTASVPFNSTSISVASTHFPLMDGQVIRFGDCLVTVVGNYQPSDTDSIIRVQPVSENLPMTVGFLYNNSTKSYVVGTDEWSEEDTKDCSDEFVSAIYKFYENERSRWKVEPESAPAPVTEGEQLPVLQLTGEVSTGESSPTEFSTPDLETGIVS
ncbi:MAG: hypothetical protein RLZZ184_36 [Cyanobacteriota bacterium]|jgi:hypothetical protein